MGVLLSLKKENQDRMKRQNLDYELQKMQNSLRVTATSHYIASEYYRRLDSKLQYASVFTGASGSTGSVASTLAWKRMISTNPRLAPILAAISTTSMLFTAVVHLPLQNSPGSLYQAHFKSGIECQYLEKQVKFLRKTEVWDSNVPWTTLASRYDALLREKKEVNAKVQSEHWSYRLALKKIDDREKEKKAGGQ